VCYLAFVSFFLLYFNLSIFPFRSFPSAVPVFSVPVSPSFASLSTGIMMLWLTTLGVAAPSGRLPHPGYIAALDAAPSFSWALAQVAELVVDFEWDPRPARKAAALNPDGSYFNRWTHGTLIDLSLSMADAVAASQDLPNPFAELPPVAPSLLRLVGRVAGLGPGILASRSERVARMLYIGQVLAPLSSQLVDAFMPKHALTIAGHLHIALLEVLSRAIRSPAPFVPEDMLFGFGVCGEIYPHGFFRPVLDAPPSPFARSNEQHLGDVRAFLERGWRDASKHHELTRLWDVTVAEVDGGFMRGPFSERQLHVKYGWCEWRPMVRFAVWQGDKLRPCDNAAASGHNDATQCFETICCTSAEWPSRVAAAWFAAGVDDVRGGTDDVASAYRKVVNAQPHLTIVALINPHTGNVAYFEVPGFNFGLKSAVVAFNSVMELTTEILRRVYLVVCEHFYDDVCTCEPGFAGSSGQDCVWSFHDIINLAMAVRKHVGMGLTVRFLGCITDFTNLRRLGQVHLRVCPVRRAKIIAALLAFIAAWAMSSAAAARVKGKVFFVSLQAWGRGGRAALQELTVRQYSRYGGDALSEGLGCALQFLVAFIPVMPPATIHLRAADRIDGFTLLVWTDAMYERVKVVPPGGMGSEYAAALDEVSGEVFYLATAVLSITVCHRFLQEDGSTKVEWSHSRYDVGVEVLRQLVPGKKTYIGQLESLAGAAFYYTYDTSRLKGRQIYHWIDNLAAVAGLAKGYSGKADTARIINSFNVRQAYLLFRVWWEWIPTHQNIADLPSRWKLQDLVLGSVVEILPGIFSTSIPFILPPFETWLSPLEHGINLPLQRRPRGKRAGAQH
jgi:hypothetical protein